ISLIMPSKKINYSSKNDKLKKQAEFGLKYLDNAYNIFLDINGKQFDSVTFASFFEKVISNKKIINFFIGGDEGFDEKFKKNSDIIISLSPHTFNHELVTLILFEIIYRTFSIIRNYPYHK
ncbi:MAG: 23S rRNA (pseudouridine(1915)-N(3))-methyltransferase RlmH, partial [Patescibacteria group bacterium]|nr:23S rRNA (pseudouridine(1915)-N(3))-methyltransferase RlmH [Patescibacteria group bacterium]